MTDHEAKDSLDFDYRAYGREMYDVLAERRAECPVLHGSKYGGFWLLYQYDDVVTGAMDIEHLTSTKGVNIPPKNLPTRSVPVESDPPEHGKYRRLVQPFLTSPAIERMEDQIRAIVVEHLDAIVEQGETDLMETFADPVPPIVLGMVMGIDRSKWPLIREHTQRIYRSTTTADAEEQAAANADLKAIITDEIESRREEPRDDLLSHLVNSQVDGERISFELAYGMVQLLVIAGHETTIFGIGNVIDHIIDQPDLYEQLRHDAGLVDRVVDESLRLESPVFSMARTVVTDVCMHGQDLKTDEKVLLGFAAANHDPSVFPEPEQFDPQRPNLRHQLAFGHGRHRCLGEHLARAEMRIAVQEVLRMLPGLRRGDEGRPGLVSGPTRGPRTLPVAWNPPAKVSAEAATNASDSTSSAL